LAFGAGSFSSILALALLSIPGMMGSFALVCLSGAGVFFMLWFLGALLREAMATVMRPRIRRIVRQKMAGAAFISLG
jgi:hypothetical protein